MSEAGEPRRGVVAEPAVRNLWSRSRVGAAFETWVERRDWSVFLVVIALTALAFALRVRGLGEGLWGDETATLHETRGRDLFGAVREVAVGDDPGEFNPPFYFVLAWLGTKLGEPTMAIRLPSLVLGIATVPLGFLLGRRTVGDRPGLVAAAFMALSPFATFYGIEARSYATLMFLCTLSALVLLMAVRTGRGQWWAAYGLSAAAVLYTHYTGIFVIAAEGAWALWWYRERWRGLGLAYAGAAAAYAPWLPYMHGDPANFEEVALLKGWNHWNAFLRWVAGNQELAPRDMPGIPALTLLGCGMVVGLVGWLLVAVGRRRTPGAARSMRHSRDGLLVLLLALATPVALLVYAWLSTDLFVLPRNLSASLPFAALAIGLALTPPNRIAMAAAVALAGVALTIGAIRMLDDKFHRPNIPAVARLLDERVGQGDLVVYYGGLLWPHVLRTNLPLYYQRSHLVSTAATEDKFQRSFRGDRPRRVFLVEVQADGETPSPMVGGWAQVERRVFSCNPPLVVSVYQRL